MQDTPPSDTPPAVRVNPPKPSTHSLDTIPTRLNQHVAPLVTRPRIINDEAGSRPSSQNNSAVVPRSVHRVWRKPVAPSSKRSTTTDPSSTSAIDTTQRTVIATASARTQAPIIAHQNIPADHGAIDTYRVAGNPQVTAVCTAQQPLVRTTSPATHIPHTSQATRQPLAKLRPGDNVWVEKQYADEMGHTNQEQEPVQQPTFSKVGLHVNFFALIPDRQALATLKEALLPHVPSCPGPYLLPDKEALERPRPTQVFTQALPYEAHCYTTVAAQGKPNYRGARLTISALPLHVWREKLRGYPDWQLVAFMRYGWPMGYEGASPPELTHPNHGSARSQPQHVSKYVDKEASLHALAGPFPEPPFSWFRVNPMMTREKKEPGCFRVVLDLSFPCEDSVNGHIDKHLLEGAPYKLHLPNPLHLANIITQKGKGALLFKLDLARVYRQLPSDPWDWPLLGISWDAQYYFDKAIPFGVRHGAMACQRVSNALGYVAKQEMDTDSLSYIDDTIAVVIPNNSLAQAQYQHFVMSVDTLGLQLAPDKCVQPTTCLSWIGVTADTVLMTMRIDDAKIAETTQQCQDTLPLKQVTKSALQSLMGKLNYATKLAPHARIFLNRASTFLGEHSLPRPYPSLTHSKTTYTGLWTSWRFTMAGP